MKGRIYFLSEYQDFGISFHLITNTLCNSVLITLPCITTFHLEYGNHSLVTTELYHKYNYVTFPISLPVQ